MKVDSEDEVAPTNDIAKEFIFPAGHPNYIDDLICHDHWYITIPQLIWILIDSMRITRGDRY